MNITRLFGCLMTDILPKNPHASYNLPNLIDNDIELAKLEGWQQGQDETMKALRLILKNCIRIIDRIYLEWQDDLIFETKGELEQLLKETE